MILDRATFSSRLPSLVVALFPVFFLSGTEWLRGTNVDLYISLFSEDRVAEYGQAIMYFAACAIAFGMARTFLKGGEGLLGAAHVLLGLALLFVAGEEISWGQRILLIDSPEYFLQNNNQEEINLHNLSSVQRLDGSFSWFSFAYGVVQTYAAFAWAFVPSKLVSRMGGRMHFVVPGWYLMPYIIAPSWSIWCTTCGPAIWQMQEAGEFLMAMGVLLFVWIGRRRLRSSPIGAIDSIEGTR